MTLINPDKGPSGLSSSVETLERQLSDMTADLEALQQKLRAGQPGALEGRERALSDVRQWLKIALEAEAHLEKRKHKEQHIAGGYALDLDTARASVGCRLDRLRRSRCPGRIPK